MVREVTLSEATGRNNHFRFANFQFWWRGVVVGGKMDNEVTVAGATEKNHPFLIRELSGVRDCQSSRKSGSFGCSAAVVFWVPGRLSSPR